MIKQSENKFSGFSTGELLEILAAFQACSRDNKKSRALFEMLEAEIESRQV